MTVQLTELLEPGRFLAAELPQPVHHRDHAHRVQALLVVATLQGHDCSSDYYSHQSEESQLSGPI